VANAVSGEVRQFRQVRNEVDGCAQNTQFSAKTQTHQPTNHNELTDQLTSGLTNQRTNELAAQRTGEPTSQLASGPTGFSASSKLSDEDDDQQD
jgi:hypothetical protein